MSEDNQIFEMAKLITEGARPAVEDADALYNAGYRKQSKGEWIEAHTIDDGWTQYRCNGCGWNTESYYKEKYDLHRYCPNCGAKMRGE